MGCYSSKQVVVVVEQPPPVVVSPISPCRQSPQIPRRSSLGVIRRLAAEFSEIQKGDNKFQISINEESMTFWTAVIFGPQESIYQGGNFLVDLIFSFEYPFTPPRVTFRTPIFHPNISTNGAVCLDILKPGIWSPLITIESLLVSIQSLLDDANPDDPLNNEAADLFVRNPRLYAQRAHEETIKYGGSRANPVKSRQDDPFSYLQIGIGGNVVDEDDAVQLAVRNSRLR